MQHASPAPWLLAATLLIAGALATVTWTSTSQVGVGVVTPPVHFVAGDNADNPRYMRSFELSTNATSFTAEVKPRPGAQTAVEDIVRIDNSAHAEERSIRLTATQVTNPNIEAFEWTIMDAGSPVATLDYRVASPEASFTLPAGETFEMDLHVDLADGAGRTNAGITFDLQMEVTP